MAYGVDDEAKKLGVAVVKVNAGGDANVNQQISQLQDLVQRHVNAIVVGATNGDAVRPAVEQAIDAGIPVVGLSSIPNSPKLASAVGADHYAMGKLQAECLGKAIGGSGEVGMMAGPAGQTWSDGRADGFRDTIKAQFPNIKIVTNRALPTIAMPHSTRQRIGFSAFPISRASTPPPMTSAREWWTV